jgi:thiamine-monophosphate kinase
MTEFDLIAELFAPLAGEGAFGLGDDVALVASRAGCDLVVTTDALVAGIDFFADDPPALIARKALRVNLSDLAAKGAEPQGYLLTLMLPDGIDDAFLRAFAQGLAEDQRAYGIALLGGDMSRTPGPLAISITAFGHVPTGRMVRRGGAKAGDHVFVTGAIGDSAGGLAILKGEAQGSGRLVARYRLPEPRVSLAPALRDATAAIDVSDGLIADLGHVAEASGVRIAVDAGLIPRSPDLRALWGDSEAAIVRAATAGDDYEVAFTASRPLAGATRIGRVEEGAGVVLLDAEGREIAVARKGFTHF